MDRLHELFLKRCLPSARRFSFLFLTFHVETAIFLQKSKIHVLFKFVQWNSFNTATNRPYEFDRINGIRSNFMAGICIVR